MAVSENPTENIIKGEYNSPSAPSGAKRYNDEQEIRPGKAPLDRETTGHRRKRTVQNRAATGRFTKGPRSMGRYPFLTLLAIYLKDRKEIRRIADSTLNMEGRMLKLIHRDIQVLIKERLISTSNPRRMTEKDISELLRYMNTRGQRPRAYGKSGGIENEDISKYIKKDDDDQLDQNTVAKYMQFLSSFLCWAGNPAMARLKELKYLPKSNPDKEIISLDTEDAVYLMQESQNIDGWHGDILALTIPAIIIQGFRGQELFKAELRDIDTRKWTFFIRYPKGGKKRQKTVRIYSTLQPYVIKYLEARERQLTALGIEYNKHLFPSIVGYQVRDTPATSTFHRRIRQPLIERSNINFDYRKLRRTSGQYLKDKGASIEVVSKHLRHTTTNVTEKYYARMRDEQASEQIGEIWSRSPIRNNIITT